MCSLSTKALKCHRSNIKNQLKNLTQQDKRPINLKCVCILIREFLSTVLPFCLPNISYFPVFHIHNCNKRFYYKCCSQEQGGILDLRVLLRRVIDGCWENLPLIFPLKS